MSTVIAFPLARRKSEAGSLSEAARPGPASGPVVVILPVVRIERHDDAPGIDAAGEVVGGTAQASPLSASPVSTSPTFGAGPGNRKIR